MINFFTNFVVSSFCEIVTQNIGCYAGNKWPLSKDFVVCMCVYHMASNVLLLIFYITTSMYLYTPSNKISLYTYVNIY